MYLLIYHQQTNESQQTNEQTKVIQEVLSPEVSKLNHDVMNKKQGDQMQLNFFHLSQNVYQATEKKQLR